MIRSLLFALVLGTVTCLDFGDRYDSQAASHVLQISWRDKILQCSIHNVLGLVWFDQQDCLIFMYINNERVAAETGLTLQYEYKKLILSKVRCQAQCENTKYKDHNITPAQLEINRTIFIGLCAGAGVAFIFLLIAVFCGVRHCRGHYYKKVPEEGEPMDLEKKVPVSPPPPSAPIEEPPTYKKSLDEELAAEVRKKKVSESSEESSDEENVDGNLYNYNPNSKYNYAEMTSEI